MGLGSEHTDVVSNAIVNSMKNISFVPSHGTVPGSSLLGSSPFARRKALTERKSSQPKKRLCASETSDAAAGLPSSSIVRNNGSSLNGFPFSSDKSETKFLFSKSYPEIQPPKKICKAKDKLVEWLLELSRLGLWPLSTTMFEMSLNDIHTNLKTFIDFDKAEQDEQDMKKCDCQTCECKACSISLGKVMKEIEKRTRDDIKELCLICVKNDQFTPREGNCGGDSTHTQS